MGMLTFFVKLTVKAVPSSPARKNTTATNTLNANFLYKLRLGYVSQKEVDLRWVYLKLQKYHKT